MKWLPIRIVVPLTLMLSSIAIGGGFWWLEHAREIGEIEREAQLNIAQDLYRSATHLEYALAHHDRKALDIEIATISDDPGMDWIALVGPDGRVLAASRLAWKGRRIDALDAPDLQRILATDNAPAARARVTLTSERSAVLARIPVSLPAEKGALRSHRDAHLLARMDIARIKQRAEREIRREAAVVSAALLLIALLLGAGAHFGLTRRMRRIVRAAQDFGRGELGARTGITGRDELGRIGEAFDAMAAGIEAMTAEMFKMRRAIESMREAVIITDAAGCIEYVNPAFVRMSGFEFHDSLGRTPALLKSGEHPAEFYAAMWRTLRAGDPWHGRIVNRRKDGRLYTVEASITPIRSPAGEITHFVAVEEDISEREAIERQLAQAQKMEAVGTLVGGIAHDFNNMLAGMLGNLYLARKRAGEDERAVQLLERVETLGYRAAEMIKQLLAFARQDSVEFRPLDLSAFVREAWRLAQISIPENIRVCLDIEDAPMPIEGDATQIQQMLMNLLANARDAVKEQPDPRIEISLKIREPSEETALRHKLRPGPYARLRIADNGPGIPQADLERIFDPFYTTKPVGEGSGLGLAMVYGAMQRHGGAVVAHSREGGGACFDLWFPLCERTQEEPAEEAGVQSVDGELLLLADDEPVVLETVSEVLRQIGYRVETARDGREALELFSRQPQAWHAVVLDVVMPRMGGVEAGLEMRRLRGDVPIVFATGYDREHVLGRLEGLERIAALTKPVHPATLQRTLRALLEEGGEISA